MDELNQKIKEINEMLSSHGGKIKLVEFKDGIVKVKFEGMCLGCPYALQTFNNLIKQELEKIKEVKKVVLI